MFSVDDLVKATSIPRSTVHVYISGRSLPPPDALDALVAAMGATPQDRRAWQDALERAIRMGVEAGHLKPDTDPAQMLFEELCLVALAPSRRTA